MQILDDRKNRIGLLTGGYKNRVITSTLSSGDKEMTFEYPANGPMASQLREEYYLRTKNDEYVIKAVEKGDRFNRYTAMLNIEGLESVIYPYGFESVEKTISECLIMAFSGSGWDIGICSVTKRRTIREIECVSAWQILQKCLQTYRCECQIDTVRRTVNICTQLGEDKGCYFIESLNLKQLNVRSDTYDFFTRIYPIGKDGLTPEPIIGVPYIDNYQYTIKTIPYVWKDERYADAESLIEDASAMLEEKSKPYTVYEAEVLDLAKQSPKYKNILSYGLGDTITLISRKTKTKVKQRIVKLIDYPESPKKNSVEISNTKKTYAQLQQEDIINNKIEAISTANANTDQKITTNITTVQGMISASINMSEQRMITRLSGYATLDTLNATVGHAVAQIEINKIQHSGAIKAAADITAGKLICGTAAGYRNVATGVVYDIAYPILYAANDVVTGETSSNAYMVYPTVSLKDTQAGYSGTIYCMTYLAGVLAGTEFTVEGIASHLPTMEDGKVYIPLGILNSTHQIYFVSRQDIYAYIDNGIKKL